jgi:hypothetical protein
MGGVRVYHVLVDKKYRKKHMRMAKIIGLLLEKLLT